MKRCISRAVLTASAIMGLAMTSQAVMIDGSVSFSGTFTVDNADLNLASEFLTFVDVTVDTPTGDYAPVGQNYGPVTFTPFSFDGSEILPFQLWTFSMAGVTYSFNSTSLVKDYASKNLLSVEGSGTAYMTGKDPTPGNWYFSANRAGLKPNVTFSFSSSSDAFPVPDGGLTVTLLGLAMAGLGIVRRVVRA